jgi:hypothetical protein
MRKLYKKGYLIILLVLVATLLGRCSMFTGRLPLTAPESGKWICSELNMCLSFDKEDPYSTVLLNGRPIKCVAESDRYSSEIILFCQEANDPELELGDVLFSGVIKESGDDYLIIDDTQLDREYVFYREDS